MNPRTNATTWWMAQATIAAVIGLLPVLQFLEANPYYKFRYGFDVVLVALVVGCFFAVPLVAGGLLGHPRANGAGGARKVLLGVALVFFASQLYSTSMRQLPLPVRLGAVLLCLGAGVFVIRKRSRELTWSLALVAIAVLPYAGLQVFRHWWWIPKPPAVPDHTVSGAPAGPNDLFVLFLDGSTLTSDFLDPDHYPDPAQFPNLHRFVRDDAIWFYNAVANGPETMLSLPSMVTGKLHIARKNHFLSREQTIFSILKPRYAVRAWLHTKSTFCSGRDFERCFPFQSQDRVEPLRVALESWAYISTFRLAPISYAIGKLDEANYHRAPMVDDFLAQVATRRETPQFFTIQLFDRGRDGLRDFDRFLGDFLEILERQGRYEDAIIAIVSDHGLNTDEEGRTYGRQARQTRRLYRVPFALKIPGRGKGRVDPYAAQGIDIAPTLLARVLSPAERSVHRFDGVDVLTDQPNRPHWINLRDPTQVFRFENPDDPESKLVAVPIEAIGLPSTRNSALSLDRTR